MLLTVALVATNGSQRKQARATGSRINRFLLWRAAELTQHTTHRLCLIATRVCVQGCVIHHSSCNAPLMRATCCASTQHQAVAWNVTTDPDEVASTLYAMCCGEHTHTA